MDWTIIEKWGSELFRATYTILIFISGLWVAKIRLRKEKRENARELRKFVYLVFETFDNSFQKQINSLNQFSKNIVERENQDINFQQYATFNIDSIDKIDDTELFKAFVLTRNRKIHERTKSFSVFKTNIEYFKRVINISIPELVRDYFKRLEEFNREWNQNAKNASNLIQQFVVDIQNKNQQDPFSTGLIQITGGYLEKSKDIQRSRNPFFVWENFINPLREVCDNNVEDLRCKQLVPYLTNCWVAIENFEKHKQYYSTAITSLVDLMNETLKKTKSSMNHLKELNKD